MTNKKTSPVVGTSHGTCGDKCAALGESDLCEEVTPFHRSTGESGDATPQCEALDDGDPVVIRTQRTGRVVASRR